MEAQNVNKDLENENNPKAVNNQNNSTGNSNNDFNKEEQQKGSEDQPVESDSGDSDKVRKRAEHESGISRGSYITPTSNSNAGREI